MRIGVGLKGGAYVPEAYAYDRFLKRKGYDVQLECEASLDPNNDVNIYFMGLRPRWRAEKNRAIEVHEYQSLSVPPYSVVKDWAKVLINKKPSGRIFLNHEVSSRMHFFERVPYIYRDMGVDAEMFQSRDVCPEFDIVYCGSISGRKGLRDVLVQLANRGFKIIVVGDLSLEDAGILKASGNVTLTGRLARHEIPEIYRKCYAGLNFTPDIFPFNLQTSTKTLEYLASGLQVVSNDYFWIRKFAKERWLNVVWLNSCESPDVVRESVSCVDVHDLSWDAILEQANLSNFLHNLVSN